MEEQTTSTDRGEAVAETALKYIQDMPEKNDLPFEEGKRYTYSDYCTWEDFSDGKCIRYELIDGIPTVMDGPNRRHQEISGELFAQLHTFLKGKPCKVYAAPFDVRLNADGADDTVVQPDIIVICDHSILTDAGASGSPDMVVEILSPGTAQRDRLIKLRLYERYGIREYWIAEPDTGILTVYTLKDGKYSLEVYDGASTVPVSVLEGCVIDLSEVF